MEGDLSSIKETLANISTKLQSNGNALPRPPYASVVGRQPQQQREQSPTDQGQGQGRGQAGGVHRQYADRYGNQDEAFLNRLRQDKARFMIVFGIKEEDFEGANEMDQKTVDRYTIGQILEDMKQKDLINRVVSYQRLGSKTDGCIRPIRVEFDSVMSRDTACRNARELRNSERYKNVASIARDKTREDRERDRAAYLASKHQRTLSGSGSVGAAAGTPTAVETDGIRGERPVEGERDQSHPQVAPERVQP